MAMTTSTWTPGTNSLDQWWGKLGGFLSLEAVCSDSANCCPFKGLCWQTCVASGAGEGCRRAWRQSRLGSDAHRPVFRPQTLCLTPGGEAVGVWLIQSPKTAPTGGEALAPALRLWEPRPMVCLEPVSPPGMGILLRSPFLPGGQHTCCPPTGLARADHDSAPRPSVQG